MKYLKRIEPFVFLAVILLNLSPLFVAHYFTTMDGGSHINNAHILKTLFSTSHSIYSDVFIFNPEMVPNWSGHILLAGLLFLFSGVVAEKILVACLLILIPFFIRKIIRLIAPENIISSYFVFPFTQYVLLYFGFFNFSLGILFFVILLYYFIKYSHSFKWHHYLILALLFMAIYFSHLFVFLISILFVGGHLGCSLLFANGKVSRNKLLFKSIIVLICSFPFLYLSINYFLHRPAKSPNEIQYYDSHKIIKMFFDGDEFTVYSNQETPYSKMFVSIILILFLFTVAKKAYNFIRSDNKLRRIASFCQRPEFIFLLLAFYLLLLAFRLPNDDGYGGFITIRFIYFSMLFLFLFIACQPKSFKIINVLALVVTAYSYYYSVQYKKDGIKWLNAERSKFDTAFAMIPNNAVVAPYLLSNNDVWLGGHLMEYANSEKQIIVLNNYEADKGYFPLVINRKKFPKYMIADYTISEGICKDCEGLNTRPAVNVNYVLIYGKKDNNEEYNKVITSIGSRYIVAYSSPTINLYKLN